MPRMNGYQLYARIIDNPSWAAIPFVFLTARSLDSDIRYGKELGVDDYLTKPFRVEDLIATVRGGLRRARRLAEVLSVAASPSGLPSEEVSVGQLHIDQMGHRVWMEGQPIRLSAREFTLLASLASRRSQVVSLRELVQATHGLVTDDEDAGSLLRPLVRSVRRKLGWKAGERGLIESVRGVGYQLVVPAASR
jgi:DNA-binding response OmpR family regulator